MTESHHPKAPDTLLLLLALALIAWLVAQFAPAGHFIGEPVQTSGKARSVSLSDYQPARDWQPPSLFSEDATPGLLNALFDGLTSGGRESAAVGIIAFLFVVGGAFGMIQRTGVIERGLSRMVLRLQSRPGLLLASLAVTFSLGGAVLGLGEEVIAYLVLLLPLFARLGYPAWIALITCYLPTQVGFATSWMNPFSVVVAQGIAGVPVLSGAGFRGAAWALFTTVTVVWVLRSAARARAPGAVIEVGDLPAAHRADLPMLLLLAGGLVWVVWGVSTRGYYIAQIATQLFTTGLAIGAVSLLMRVPGVTLNALVEAFKTGAAGLLPCALVIALAKSLVILLGGADPSSPSVLNALLFSVGSALQDLPPLVAAEGMLAFQALFNFLVPSGTGQAAITMPLMAPLGDLVGVTRQVSVLAFQFGDGLTNLVVPTSAVLMGALGVAKIEWWAWIKRIFWFELLLLGMAAALVAIAVETGLA